MTNKYYIKTLGCQMNHSDSERIAGLLEKYGFEKASDIKEADLVVFNTCGVRQMAEDRVYGQIHNLVTHNVERGTKKSKVKIVLTGCLAHRKDVQRRLKDKVDLFFSINNFKEFENWIIGNYLEIVNWKLEIPAQNHKELNKENVAYLSTNPKYANGYQAFVPVMTGCNNFCSYCVVPYARGREVSKPANEVIKEVKSLIKKGYREIILLGQNVNSYISPLPSTPSPRGRGWGEGTNFSELLRKINAIPGNFWISFVSNHPKDFSDELIETATKLKKICEYIHLPIQAGDNKVLQNMNRKYTREQYLKLIDKIRKSFKKFKPGKLYSITSDIIVGFPGETKKQFLKSAEAMKKVKYDMVYFGQFSPRPETVSWKMKDNVSKKEKVRRENYLNEILKKTSFENNKKYIGRIMEVLIDHMEVRLLIGSRTSEHIYFGRTRTMKNVKIISNKKTLVGKIIKVRITKANIWNLEAKIK
ncbi:MAG: tRNA (N6-isopentenyl adenosine(37)-C2)-methylthiotransferase MiaB [Patescibacteria group bacterium]